jgi:hypothetical protein
MDFQALKRCWQAEADADPLPAWNSDRLSVLVATRAADIRRQVRHRLRGEIGCYVPTLLAMFAMTGASLTGVLFVISFACVFAGVIATLWMWERRLAAAPLDRPLRVVLDELIARIEGAGRAYLTAYVIVFVCAAVILAAVIWVKRGPDMWFAAALVVGVLGVAWSYRSGRSYVDRMFESYRTSLADCLQRLDRA